MFLPSSLASQGSRLLVTFVIFALSSGVVGGVLFYLDWTGPQVFQAGVEDVPVDMELELASGFYEQNTTPIENITNTVREQEEVTGIELVSFIQTWEYEETDYGYYQSMSLTYLGVDGSFFNTFPDAIEVASGTAPLNDSTCYIQNEMLGYWGAEIGKNVTIYVFTYDEYGYMIRLNYTLLVVGTFRSQLFTEEMYWQGPRVSTLRVITTKVALAEAFGGPEMSPYWGLRDRIWVALDRAAVMGEDPANAADKLDSVRKRIEQRTLPYASVPYDGFGLLEAVIEFSAWSSNMRAISLCASLPAIIMGIMLVHYDSALIADQRRRDLGTLKTRGGSGWQAFNWVLTTALFTGFIGSIGAVITGFFAAAVSGTVRTLFEFQFSQIWTFVVAPLPGSVAFVFLFSFAVGLLVALPTAVRGLLMSATEAHAAIEQENLLRPEKAGNPWIDLVGLAISSYLLVGLLMALSFASYMVSIQVTLSIIVVPFLAIFLFTFTRLLSRPTATIEAKVLSWLRRPSLSPGAAIIGRNLAMFQRSQSLGVMFVAMVFTAGVFSGLSATTGYYHMRDLLMFQAGSDITIDVNPGRENVTLSIMDNVTTVTGVSSAAAMFSVTGYVRYRQEGYFGSVFENRSIRVFGVQAHEWYRAGFWLPYFAYSRNPEASLERLAESNASVITSFRPIISHVDTSTGPIYTYGNSIDVTLVGTSWTNKSACTIVDVLGEDQTASGKRYFPGEPDLNDFLIINLAYVQSCVRTVKIERIYIHTEENTNYTQVIDSLYRIAPDSFKHINSGLKRIDDALGARSGRSIFGVYTLNLLFSLTYLTIGMAIVSIDRVRRLRRQLSVFRALGGQTKSITVSVLVETATGVLIAAAIGGLLGLVLSSLIMTLPLTFFGTETAALWSRLPVQIVIPVELLLSIVGLTFLCTLFTTFIVTRRGLTRNIAEEIQVEE